MSCLKRKPYKSVIWFFYKTRKKIGRSVIVMMCKLNLFTLKAKCSYHVGKHLPRIIKIFFSCYEIYKIFQNRLYAILYTIFVL